MEFHPFNRLIMEKKANYKSLIIEETKYKTYLTKKFENRIPWEKPDEKVVLSFIPGTILKIKVKDGQTIKKGHVLYTLETMKMKNKVASPITGTIKKINVSNGEKIPKNHLILKFE